MNYVIKMKLLWRYFVAQSNIVKFAAIDIGSNAIRFQISSVLDTGPKVLFKKWIRALHCVWATMCSAMVNWARKALRSSRNWCLPTKLFVWTLRSRWLHDLRHQRHARIKTVKNWQKRHDEIGITINIIDGQQEAELINKAIASYLTDKPYLHIDVGGGSTELNLYVGGKKIQNQII